MRLMTLLLTGSITFAGVPNDLEGFLRNLTVEARADRNGFAARLCSQFRVSGVQVRTVLGAVEDPGDAFLVLQLCQYTRLPQDRVLTVYRSHHHRGWGAMAHELGIRPGSRAFRALKRGDYRLVVIDRQHCHDDDDDDDDDHGHRHRDRDCDRKRDRDHGHGRGHHRDRDRD